MDYLVLQRTNLIFLFGEHTSYFKIANLLLVLTVLKAKSLLIAREHPNPKCFTIPGAAINILWIN